MKFLYCILFLVAFNATNEHSLSAHAIHVEKSTEKLNIIINIPTEYIADYIDENTDDSLKHFVSFKERTKIRFYFSRLKKFHCSEIIFKNLVLLNFYSDLPPPSVA